jgi:hypothetical protein
VHRRSRAYKLAAPSDCGQRIRPRGDRPSAECSAKPSKFSSSTSPVSGRALFQAGKIPHPCALFPRGHNGDIKRAAHGYEPMREAATAFAKSWRRDLKVAASRAREERRRDLRRPEARRPAATCLMKS